MLWRLRARIPDQPGALAAFADRCGQAGVNILGLQIFPEADTVTDELVLRVPLGWGEDEIADLVTESGGISVDATPASEAALDDQPTRFVEAARAVIAHPESFPAVAARLFDADVDHGSESLEMTVADVAVQIRRQVPFTPTEQTRAHAMAALVTDVLDAQRRSARQEEPKTEELRITPTTYETEGDEVLAKAGSRTVGSATLTRDESDAAVCTVDLRVDPRLRRQGIGSRLLTDATKLAANTGAEEVVLTAAADNQAVLPMVMAAGLRGRIRMAGDTLTVRINVAPLRRR